MKNSTYILLGMFTGVALFMAVSFFSPQHSSVPLTNEPLPTKIPTPTIRVGLPISISIPKLNLQAHVEEVGLDMFGRMDVPKKVDDVGWFDEGYRPGAMGSAVIDGHLDTVTGAPAVFYYISQMEKGDIIQISDDTNKKYTFQVIDKKEFPYDGLPLSDIFGPSPFSNLNLITCRGIWDRTSRNYSKRLVIYSRLISS